MEAFLEGVCMYQPPQTPPPLDLELYSRAAQVAHGHEFLVRNPALYGFSDNQLKDAIRIRFQYFVETRNSKTVKHSLFSDAFNVSCIKLETVYIVRPAIYGTRSTWELLHHTPLMYQPLIVNREVN